MIYTGDGGIIVLLPQHRTGDRLPGLARARQGLELGSIILVMGASHVMVLREV